MNKIKLKYKILFTIIIMLVISFFVRVKKIDIKNNRYHNEEYIEKLVFPSDLSRISLYAAIKNYLDSGKYDVPNIERINIKFLSPFHVELNVFEKPIIGFIRSKEKYYYFDEDLCMLTIEKEKNKDYIEIVGVSIKEDGDNKYINIDNDKAHYIIKKIGEYSDIMNMPIDNVDFTNPNAIEIVGDGLFVNIGNGDFIEEKISLIIDMYPKLQGLSGELDLSKVKSSEDRGEYIFKKH